MKDLPYLNCKNHFCKRTRLATANFFLERPQANLQSTIRTHIGDGECGQSLAKAFPKSRRRSFNRAAFSATSGVPSSRPQGGVVDVPFVCQGKWMQMAKQNQMNSQMNQKVGMCPRVQQFASRITMLHVLSQACSFCQMHYEGSQKGLEMHAVSLNKNCKLWA